MASRIFVSIFILFVLSNGCTVRSNELNVTASAPAVATVTLPTAPTSSPSETPLPVPPAQPTAVPMEGTASTQINVRAEPSTASNVLGIIPANTKIQILGKDPGGNWLQIIYSQGVDGKGWVTAQYVTLATGVEVPVIVGGGTNPGGGSVAIVQQQLNVRSGPGTSFNSLGTLNAQDVVNLTGKDSNGAWLQIEFASGPDGKGWVNAAFVQAKGVENLPIITDAGQVVGTGTPTAIPPTATPTVVPAWADNDSPDNPVANVIFEPSGINMLIYNGDVSTPQGDPEDWVNFTPYSDSVYVSLLCMGSDSLQAELLQDGTTTNMNIVCGSTARWIKVVPGSSYGIHFYALQSSDVLQYINYTIKIQTSP